MRDIIDGTQNELSFMQRAELRVRELFEGVFS
jgi:hypothetical protein